MKKSHIILSFVLGVSLSLPLAAKQGITINNDSLYPEGVSYDAQNNLFYVSSVSRGEVWRINSSGKGELFVKNNKFASTIGLQVDNKRNRLLVCIADPGVGKNSNEKSKGKTAGLAIYDLTSKKQLAYYDLSTSSTEGGFFANDVTIDKHGNSYITDSFSPNIYKVSISGKVSIFAKDPRWSVKKGKFGLNGIVFHPDGFLIVSHYDSGKLFKVDINESTNVEEIKISQNGIWKVTGLDGLLLTKSDMLIAVNNDPTGRKNGNVVYKFQANKNWNKLDIVGAMPTSNTYPTTLTSNKNDIFVLHSKLLELFTGNKKPKKSFEIEKVYFLENFN